jgi:nitric oxide reductase
VVFGKSDQVRVEMAICALTCLAMTLLQRLPNLKLAEPFETIKWTPPKKDVGITELQVMW